MEIARIVTVPTRRVLAHEEHHFSHWLADNLDLISTLLGGTLELVEREARVGSFSADLLCRMAGEDDSLVVIENQYGVSDHDHLGKLLTYSAGLGVKTAVLVAERIREEHRLALEWLNATSPDISYWGLKFSFVRILDSAAAPQFRDVVRPAEPKRSGNRVSASRRGRLTTSNTTWLSCSRLRRSVRLPRSTTGRNGGWIRVLAPTSPG